MQILSSVRDMAELYVKQIDVTRATLRAECCVQNAPPPKKKSLADVITHVTHATSDAARN